ncbi:acyltransferase family protein [Legionella cardiaca]|uniref:Acyltransferase n=1 Tax=Legionella cardiaca TaxID=1071983 RepID=A0ABY8ARQ0_9GAMM|nr:acyltransferase [Legionella cardiaca]WED41877.1 acyltransferase [Legionella cardiaca]
MIKSIQGLRLLAAWMVVFHHFTQIYFNFEKNNWFVLFFSNYGAYGVDLFFVISGFVIYHSTADKMTTPKQFILHRLIRIAPAYWFFTLVVTILVVTCKGLIPLTAFELSFFFKSLLFLPAHNPSGIGFYPLLTIGWTLNYEMIFYMIFALTLYLPLKLRFIATAVGLLSIVLLSSRLGGSFLFYSNKIMFEFLFGILINFFWRKKLIQRINAKGAIILLLLAITSISIQEPRHHFLRLGIPCALIFTAVISQDRWFNNDWLIRLGNWSYSTYLCHPLILAISHLISLTLGINPFLMLCLSCLLILVVSFWSYSFIEKPIQRYFKLQNPEKNSVTFTKETFTTTSLQQL